jgi:hypothetical protein
MELRQAGLPLIFHTYTQIALVVALSLSHFDPMPMRYVFAVCGKLPAEIPHGLTRAVLFR